MVASLCTSDAIDPMPAVAFCHADATALCAAFVFCATGALFPLLCFAISIPALKNLNPFDNEISVFHGFVFAYLFTATRARPSDFSRQPCPAFDLAQELWGKVLERVSGQVLNRGKQCRKHQRL
jgi:hypothetical protein